MREIAFRRKADLPQITLRATITGLLIGSVVLISNFQFGLQTGWVSMMSLPSALLGFTIFKAIKPFHKHFTDVENVYVQSLAVAVGTGPLAYGLVGIIPAIEKFLTPEEAGGQIFKLTTSQLMIWSTGLAFFGVFFAVLLRKQVIIKEKLPFPSGNATATLISVLHGSETLQQTKKYLHYQPQEEEEELLSDVSLEHPKNDIHEARYRSNIFNLSITFSVSALYTIVSHFYSGLRSIPLFGSYLSLEYMWNFQPLPAYIGQGIIMGLPTVSYMLFGAILGWGILAPMARHEGWAPGDIDNWINGGQGWILWISLSAMISDSIVAFVVITIKSIFSVLFSLDDEEEEVESTDDNVDYNDNVDEETTLIASDENRIILFNSGESTYTELRPRNLFRSKSRESKFDDDYIDHKKHSIPPITVILGLILSSVLCVVCVRSVFGPIIPYYALVCAIILALFFSVLGVRALGETDLNPVSGIGKLSQLIFAVIIPANHPFKILINIVAGGIAEAGAQQAGDLMQDLKTGHLLGASPKAQFIAQIIGTLYSIILAPIMYKVYNSVYEIPGSLFRIPTAVVWIDCSRLVTGDGLPPHVWEYCLIFGIIFGAISLVKNTIPIENKLSKYLVFLPNGVAVGVGMYNTPNFTLARFVGGIILHFWNVDDKIALIIFSSGLVLGEGLLSAFTMLLTSFGY
ncbi:uncharacterized protein KQ657_002195 [Scheffersomyces spartinae]|uniref:Oligopeptide transporter n=1 Tax=Scheffersomyces spartinae TaxID=45513 RepID=A0A9P8AJU9_9ASCO|nr:uncharacterized protein KQ657_002195 [Scheffersomyces spartinae]KAG7195810.1 hypothetical protein KQ657_002195 [Scheffersomyces spartinae]